MRDDRSVLGTFTLHDFLQAHVLPIANNLTKISPQIENALDPILQDCISVLFEWYQNSSQNTCRYRQGYNRQILLWDSVQAQLENVLTQLGSSSRLVVNQSGTAQENNFIESYASWAFVMKLNAMIEFTLKGFDLDCYKPFESYSLFWYVYYLCEYLQNGLNIIETGIQRTISDIHALNKRMKKLKAGEKKDRLRDQYHKLMELDMPGLQDRLKYMQYERNKCKITQSLCLVEVVQFGILASYNVITNKNPANSKFVNDELIYKLRFKPFSSIGSPETPTFTLSQETLQKFMFKESEFSSRIEESLKFMKGQLNHIEITIGEILRYVESDDEGESMMTGTRLVKEEASEYFTQLKKSSELLKANSKRIVKVLGPKPVQGLENKFTVMLSTSTGASRFFPILEVVERKPRGNGREI